MISTLRRLLPPLLLFPVAAQGNLVTTVTDEDGGAPGVNFPLTATGVTISDTNPLPSGGFYRFEARLEP